jgi:hypothetical protein
VRSLGGALPPFGVCAVMAGKECTAAPPPWLLFANCRSSSWATSMSRPRRRTATTSSSTKSATMPRSWRCCQPSLPGGDLPHIQHVIPRTLASRSHSRLVGRHKEAPAGDDASDHMPAGTRTPGGASTPGWTTSSRCGTSTPARVSATRCVLKVANQRGACNPVAWPAFTITAAGALAATVGRCYTSFTHCSAGM